jgi:hypothetical protein
VNTTADNTTDTSVLTLRDAITLVNNGGNPASLGQASMPAGWSAQIDTTNPFGSEDTIDFYIPTSDPGYQTQGSTTWFTIAPQSALPNITSPVLINGYSQPGASQNTLLGPCALGSMDSKLNPQNYGDNAVLKIELDGAIAGTSSGLVLTANNITVQGLVINRFAAPGIQAGGVDTIQGNFLGTDVTGTQALGNGGADVISGQATISGTASAARNIISGALNTYPVYADRTGGFGVLLTNSGAVVQGNFIGTDITGTKPLGNA